jgi:hypothetical protein
MQVPKIEFVTVYEDEPPKKLEVVFVRPGEPGQ